MTADDAEAARWAIAREGGAMTAGDQAALDAWLEVDARRAGALLRAEATLMYLGLHLDRAASDEASPVGTGDGASASVPRRDEGTAHGQSPAIRARWFDRRRRMVAGGGIGLLAAGLATLVVVRPHDATEHFETRVGQVSRIALRDGTVAMVNTDSAVSVALSAGTRNVSLDRGEAWFAVKTDRARPFVVSAGKVRVRAVGTAFSVRRRPGGTDVLVTQGVVESWIVGHRKDARRIAVGGRSFVADSATVEPAPVAAAGSIERALAWRTGDLQLNGETLGYAVDEFNRYNSRKLRVDDAQLKAEPLVGLFRLDHPEQFGRTVAAMVEARVEDDGGTIVLSR